MATSTTRSFSIGSSLGAVLSVVAAVLVATLGTASLASASAGDDLVLGTTNSSGATTYLNWDKATFPVQEAGVAVRGDLAGGVFATNEEYMGNQLDWITGVQGYGNDLGGYFYGVDIGAIADAEYVGLRASASEVGVEASGDTAVQATGRSVGLSATGDTAIQAEGAVSFSTAGLATVARGSSSVTVPADSDITGETKVLATAQSAGGQVLRVRRNVNADTITIQLTAPATRNVTVAYFVMQ